MAITLVMASLGAGIYLFVVAGDLTKVEEADTVARRLAIIGDFSLVAAQRQAALNRIWFEGMRQTGVPESKWPALPPAPNITDRILPEPNAYSGMASTIGTRVGAVLILIFLVQILVAMHRYSLKLSSFYDGRADALELIGVADAAQLQLIAGLMVPEKIDFEALPASPAQNAADIVKDVLSKGR